METIIKLASQILFAIAAIGFVVYSIIAMYTLNTYGQPKSLTTTLSLVYGGIMVGLLSWGFIIITNIE